jgi:branched-chain amino acid transport system substrate-binding protein
LGARWVVPYAVDPAGGFADPAQRATWLAPLLEAVATAAQEQGSRRLVVAGSEPLALAHPAIPVHFVASTSPEQLLAQMEAGDAVYWMGDPERAAEMLKALTAHRRRAPFWIGPQGGDPVVAERAGEAVAGDWVVWTDAAYNGWAQTHAPATPMAYLVYRATCTALARENDVAADDSLPWQVVAYPIAPDLASVP